MLSRIFALFLAAVICNGVRAADPPSESWTFTLRFENDLFNSTDRFYTNGVKLNWISPELDWFEDLNWVKRTPMLLETVTYLTSILQIRDDELTQHNLSVSLGQQIYTPRDITVAEIIPDSRPYAGWLYSSIGFHNKNFRELESFELQLGFTGKWSLAHQAQDLVHSIRNIPKAQGWSNQIKTEPGIVLVYERKYRLVPHIGIAGGWGADAIMHLGGTLGNISTYLNSGIELRTGWKIPTDFGSALIRPGGDTNAPVDTMDVRFRDDPTEVSAYIFVATTGRLVARDIFLDGNTFAHSHRVERQNIVADLIIGGSVIYKRFKLSYAHVLRTREFEAQPGGHDFGSMSLSFTY